MFYHEIEERGQNVTEGRDVTHLRDWNHLEAMVIPHELQPLLDTELK